MLKPNQGRVYRRMRTPQFKPGAKFCRVTITQGVALVIARHPLERLKGDQPRGFSS